MRKLTFLVLMTACSSSEPLLPDAGMDAAVDVGSPKADVSVDVPMMGCGVCDDGEPCTKNVCDMNKCKFVPLGICGDPVCSLMKCRYDADGDGLSDEWENVGGIDYDCNGTIDPSEKTLTNIDPMFPDGTPNPHPSADANVKDIFVQYDFMVLPDSNNACNVMPVQGLPFNSPDCNIDEYCINSKCSGHSDAPSPAALKMVIDAFAAQNIRLHLVPGSQSGIAHSKVLSYGAPVSDCIADTSSLMGDRQAIDFYSIKAKSLDAKRKPFFHYVVFGHHHTCDSIADCAKPMCKNPDTGTQALFTETGLAEVPGNDFMVTMGRLRDRDIPPSVINQAGTFMHELGHNLGLNHGGPLTNMDSNVNFKPNYLSVMNYSFQSVGIETATMIGGLTTQSTRVDYSRKALATLDEAALDEKAGIGSNTADISYTFCPSKTKIPTTGAVDWNCANGSSEMLSAEINNDGMISKLVSYSDWDALVFSFQCVSAFND